MCFQSKWPGGAEGGSGDGGPYNRSKDEGAGNGRWGSTYLPRYLSTVHMGARGELWRNLPAPVSRARAMVGWPRFGACGGGPVVVAWSQTSTYCTSPGPLSARRVARDQEQPLHRL